MINLRDILNGLVIGSGDWSDSLTSSKAYKSSVIDDLIANDCPVCPTPCLTSCDSQYESITPAGFIPSLLLFTHLTNYHSQADAYLLQMCLHFSTPTCFIFILSSLCKPYFLHNHVLNSYTDLSVLLFQRPNGVYIDFSVILLFSLTVILSPLFSQKSQTTAVFLPKLHLLLILFTFTTQFFPLVWGLVTSCLNDHSSWLAKLSSPKIKRANTCWNSLCIRLWVSHL